MLVSEFLEVDDKLDNLGTFDARIDKDSNFFINIVRLKHSTTPEFADAYDLINKRFSEIATLLSNAQAPIKNDVFFRSARKLFNFSEVNGINLGFSESTTGSGFGDQLSMAVLEDAYQIVKAGSTQPELFHLVSLFEENVGPDRLSDMIASIIKPRIISYTRRILNDLDINPTTRPHLGFDDDGLLINPYKRCQLLLLPTDVLYKLPIAKNWEDIGYAAEKNAAIRREINHEIGDVWEKWSSSDRKNYVKEKIFMRPDVCERVVSSYRNEQPPALDLSSDPGYFSEVLFGALKKGSDFTASDQEIDSYEGAKEVVAIFKHWIEFNHGWSLLRGANSLNREKIAQMLIHLCAKYYVEKNNLDISFEPNAGRGPVDIKFSRGADKTVVETKLSTNHQYLHGYEVQVDEYAKSENTEKSIYVLIDLGNPRRIQTIIDKHRINVRSGNSFPDLVIVDAKEKKSASVYEPENTIFTDFFNYDEEGFFDCSELDFTLPEIELEDFQIIDGDNLGLSDLGSEEN